MLWTMNYVMNYAIFEKQNIVFFSSVYLLVTMYLQQEYCFFFYFR